LPAPAHVTDLEAYQTWLDQIIDESGGHLEPFVLVVEQELDEDDRATLLVVPPQRLTFWDGTVLVMSFVVDEYRTVVKYTFHYMREDGTLIWRKDNVHRHRGHRDQAHLHRRPGQDHFAESYRDVDPDEALGEVREYQHTGAIPVPPA
jgi:hypothetical protein